MTIASPSGSKETARGTRVGAWVLSVVALWLALTGWFTIFGLVVSIPAIVLARLARARGPLIVGCAALVAALAWIAVGQVVS